MKTILSLLLSIFTIAVLNAQCETFFDQTVNETTGVFTAHFFTGEDSIENPGEAQYLWEIEGSTFTGQSITYEFPEFGFYSVCLTATGTECIATFCDSVFISNDQVEDSCSMFFTYDITHASSANINDGAIDITVQGGTAPFDFAWSNYEETEDIDELSPGDYTVNVIDANACSLTYNFYVTSLDSTYSDSTVVDYIYAGAYYEFDSENDCTAEVWSEVYGGTPPYTYLWSNEEVTNSFYGACGGDFYCVTVTDADGFEAEACVAIDYYNYQDSTWIVNDTLETTIDTCLDIIYGEIVDYIIDNNLIIVTWEFVDSNEETTHITITYPANDSITPGVYEIYLFVNCDNAKSMTTYSDWIQVTEEVLSGIISPIAIQNYTLYPNPVINTLNIDIFANENKNTQIQIINTAGQIVFTTNQSLYNGPNNISLDVNNLPQGVYFVRINANSNYEINKFIK
jgi:hypothetical protein